MASNWAAELNGGEDEDAALRRAIAMSLGQDLTEEDATPSHHGYDSGNRRDEATQDKAVGRLSQAPTNSLSALGLNRKKMEQERLERMARKRKAGDASDQKSDFPPAQRSKLLPIAAGMASNASNTTKAGMSQQSPQSSPNLNMAAADGSKKPAILAYPRGVVRKTWALGQGQRKNDDIKIEEVLQKDDLELAVLSSFQWDEEWLMTKLNLRKTKVVLVAYAADDAQKAAMRANVSGDVIRFCFPPMDGVSSCMHSKLQLLKYPQHIRIVVPSGNLVPYDWGETGTMENMVFLIDLPRIQDDARRAANALTCFGDELCYFLRAQGLDEKMVASLRNYDFSGTSRFGFIHTIGGSHPYNDWQRTGYCGLGRTVSQLGLQTDDEIDIDFLCSSIGAIKLDLLQALYNACQGDSGMKEYELRAKTKKTKKSNEATIQSESLEKRIRVYFPSRDTVLRSRGGANSAGTLCFQSKWWKSSTFPGGILRDCKNVRPGILMHSKMIFVRCRSGASGWVYVGSANLSESAWGRMVKDRTTSQPKLNCRNWECGVLIPVESIAPSSASREGSEMLDIFRDAVPIPMELPGASFDDAAGDLRPWFSQDG